ncbi:CBM51 [uncultured Synechococcales cyanobacterium]|uniref:CBM51 n=1 Tax=uncultured Synechococcales cyanobacterium TaxID=1936017 RepID=A0A6J4VSX4_9CYAN|nr:CBM51 [uncultured Synechococcales cyanobacterium]
MSNSNLGNLNSGFNISNSVNTSDPNDYYSFNLTAQSSLELTLNGLNANADLQLLNNSGTVLRSSSASGINQDVINIDNLAAGTYKARVYRVGGDTAYKLETSTVDYLSNLSWTSVSNGWGPVEKNKSNGEQASGDGRTITLNGISYSKGLGVHSGSEVAYALGGKYKTFSTDVGVDDEVGSRGSVSFQVWADGAKLYDSGVMTGNTAAKTLNVDVTGKQQLKLIATNGGDNKDFDHGDWANARLAKSTTSASIGTGAPSPTPGPPLNSQTGEQAKSADSFVDSIGVTTHLRYTGTSYSNYSGIIKPRLQELGVRHIRDGGKDKAFFDKLNDLATIGIKSTLVMDPRDGTQPQDAVTIAKSIPKSLEAVEGPNEWDMNRGLTYKGQSFPNGLRNYQNELYKAINSDPATANISVLTPSLAGPGNADKLEPLDAFDKGNIHYYVGGEKSTWGLDNYVLPQIRELTENKPLVVTETGWSNAAISQQAEAKYVPRLYLEHFNRGIERTFLYEFIKQRQQDNSYEGSWGILNPDGSPQPAFKALKNLIDLVEEPGAGRFTPGKLDYKLSGAMTGVNHTLLQKSNGKFNLILWQDDEAGNNPDQSVTLTLNQPISSAKTYLPLNSTEATNSYSKPTNINLKVPDHPLVVELS